MSKKDKNIDAYSKALLDKKTEYNEELKKPKTVHEMSDEERKQAEKTMSSALDMLRKERGQKTIAEEEQFYEDQKTNLVSTDDDFTTSSIESEQSNDALNLVHAMLQDMSNDDQEADKKSVVEEKKKETKEKKKTKEPKKKNDSKKPKEKKPMSKFTKIVLGVILLGVAALGVYSYKVLVYDPQNIVSPAQQKTYDKLISYADEYGDNMMSDAEKLELLDLDSGYKKLLGKQKTSINEYFKEQTGKTYKALLKDIKELQTSKEEAKFPAYQQIMTLLDGWDAKSDEEKMAVADMQSVYSSLSKSLKKEVDSLSKSKTGKDFIDLCKEQAELKTAAQEKAQQEEEQKKSENASKIQEYQASLNSLQQDYDTYAQYAQSLESELADASDEDRSQIQSQIDTNNQMLYSLQQQITYYQQQIAALQS
ncbi:hypothetical protein [uncultured Holdemanella sp.]|uniref:hypothetical protein n=1 Tax=uncultured Holdemanella sp. TaxID=1763549 RepID=UPI0026591A48|nr:hypothetical protein [uncultured Holdemanella sp.]